MTVELRNVPSLPEPQGYAHVAIAPAGRIVMLAGQGGHDADGNVAGGLAEQTEQALLNLAAALDTAGASAADLVKLTILVVDWDQSMRGELVSGMAAAGRTRPVPAVPSTLVGVRSLFLDDMLVEIEGVAVLPEPRHG
jgi:enamine deaminase RidA (YjgF/YER057c/UK114 family)